MVENTRDEVSGPINREIQVFTAWHRETGDELRVDYRTFDPEIHSKDAPGAKSKKAKE
jgi:hypothetical protein